MSELKLGLPKGSLEAATIELFKKSGWKITTSSRSYFPSIDDDTLRVSLARPQEMSRYVESGTLDAGITGKEPFACNALPALAGAGGYTSMDIPHNTSWEIKTQ